MKCHKCGCDLCAAAKFCRSCGVQQDQSSKSQSSIAKPAIEPKSESLPPLTLSSPPIAQPDATDSLVPKLTPAQPQVSRIKEKLLQPKSSLKAALYAIIGFFIIATIGGIGYWGWAQKQAAEAQTVLVAKQQADQAQRIQTAAEEKIKVETEVQKRIKEAEVIAHLDPIIVFPEVDAYVKSVANADKCAVSYTRTQIGALGDNKIERIIVVYGVEGCGGGNVAISKLAVLDVKNDHVILKSEIELDRSEISGVENIVVIGGAITLNAKVYGPNDPRCCASLTKNIIYQFDGNKIIREQE